VLLRDVGVGQRVRDGATGAEDGQIGGLGSHVQPVGVQQVEHLTTDEDRPVRTVGQRSQPDDGVGLEFDVVVHQQQVHPVDRLVADGLVDTAREPPGAPEIRLADVVQRGPQSVAQRREIRAGIHTVAALVDDVHGAELAEDLGIRGQRGEGRQAVVRAVVGADDDRRRPAGPGARAHRPPHVLDGHAGGRRLQLQPQRSAVDELVEGDGQPHVVRMGVLDPVTGHRARVAVTVRGQHAHQSRAADSGDDVDRADRRPALPVGGGEPTEEGVRGDQCVPVEDHLVPVPDHDALLGEDVELLGCLRGRPGEESPLSDELPPGTGCAGLALTGAEVRAGRDHVQESPHHHGTAGAAATDPESNQRAAVGTGGPPPRAEFRPWSLRSVTIPSRASIRPRRGERPRPWLGHFLECVARR
jgi:hypothetical protein